MIDLDAGVVFGKGELRVDGDAAWLDFQIENDFGLAAPLQSIVAAQAEIHRARMKEKLRRRSDEIGKVAVILEAQQ